MCLSHVNNCSFCLPAGVEHVDSKLYCDTPITGHFSSVPSGYTLTENSFLKSAHSRVKTLAPSAKSSKIIKQEEANSSQKSSITSPSTILQPRRVKSSLSPERKLRCCRTGLCWFFTNFSRQPCKKRAFVDVVRYKPK